MKKFKHVKRFAKTLIETAGMEAAPKALAELGTLGKVLSGSRELSSALTGPQFTDAEKRAVIKELGGRLKLSDHTVKFVSFLAEQKAMPAFGATLNAATAIYFERKKMARAQVITPVPIDKGYEPRLRESLRKLTGREIELEYVTDPALLGGMLVKVGSTMYDGSIKGQLRLLKDELIKG